jgi:hypothetical protein
MVFLALTTTDAAFSDRGSFSIRVLGDTIGALEIILTLSVL